MLCWEAAPCGEGAHKASKGCSQEEGGGEQLEASVTVGAVGVATVLVASLRLGSHMGEELLQEVVHARDSPSDAHIIPAACRNHFKPTCMAFSRVHVSLQRVTACGSNV